jgi:hypothetical protein
MIHVVYKCGQFYSHAEEIQVVLIVVCVERAYHEMRHVAFNTIQVS